MPSSSGNVLLPVRCCLAFTEMLYANAMLADLSVVQIWSVATEREACFYRKDFRIMPTPRVLVIGSGLAVTESMKSALIHLRARDLP